MPVSQAHKDNLAHSARLAAQNPADTLTRQYAQRIINCYTGQDRSEAQAIYDAAFRAAKSRGSSMRY